MFSTEGELRLCGSSRNTGIRILRRREACWEACTAGIFCRPYQKLRQKIRNDRERTAEILQGYFADPLFEELVTYGKASDSTALKIAPGSHEDKKCYLQSGFRKDDLSGKNKTARVVFQGKIRKIGRRFGEERNMNKNKNLPGRRILVYGMSDNPGGIETYLLNLVKNTENEDVVWDFVTDFPQIAYREILEQKVDKYSGYRPKAKGC